MPSREIVEMFYFGGMTGEEIASRRWPERTQRSA